VAAKIKIVKVETKIVGPYQSYVILVPVRAGIVGV